MSDRYGVKEIFVTLQGEGVRAGQKSAFLRFSGCNLWNGFPAARGAGTGACAGWCDTDFAKGRVLDVEEIRAALDSAWPRASLLGRAAGAPPRWVVLSGGEPLLQVNDALLDALYADGWRVAIETNGTVDNAAAGGVDWICVAPKLGMDGKPLPLAIKHASEVKVVLPGDLPSRPGWTLQMLSDVEEWAAEHRARLFVQPMDPLLDPSFVEQTALKRSKEADAEQEARLEALWRQNLQQCIRHVLEHPTWSLSLQTHKFMGMP